jgi:hypothetical protein
MTSVIEISIHSFVAEAREVRLVVMICGHAVLGARTGELRPVNLMVFAELVDSACASVLVCSGMS